MFYKIFIILCCIIMQVHATNIPNQKDFTQEIEKRKKFFKEALAQPYDKLKIRKNANLEYIDFCAYPPDRSLIYGALQNGRFHGQKVLDLPFACNQNSGAKKYFLRHTTIAKSYEILRQSLQLSFLQENLPTESQVINNIHEKLYYIWEPSSNKTFTYNSTKNPMRLWIIYQSIPNKYTLIFTQNNMDTEIIVQYIGN